METKVVCLALAFLVLAMEINAVPVGPSDLVEGRQPVLETKTKKINNAWLNFVYVCVCMDCCLSYLLLFFNPYRCFNFMNIYTEVLTKLLTSNCKMFSLINIVITASDYSNFTK